jgi:hypothetical protein
MIRNRLGRRPRRRSCTVTGGASDNQNWPPLTAFDTLPDFLGMIADGGAVDVTVAVAATAVVVVISVSAGDVDVLTIDNSRVPIPYPNYQSRAQRPRREEAVRSRRRWHPSKRIECSSRDAPRSYVLRPGKAYVNNIQTTKSSHIIEMEKLAGNVPWSCG